MKDLRARLDREKREKPISKLVLSITPSLKELLEEQSGEEDGMSQSLIARRALRRHFERVLARSQREPSGPNAAAGKKS